jgi:hypothetical protein
MIIMDRRKSEERTIMKKRRHLAEALGLNGM